jgi:hypothetical protein
VQAVVSKYAVVTAIILLAAVALFFIGKSNAPVAPAVLVTAPAQDGGVKVVPASHTVTTAWDDDLRSAVESNSSRITRLENKLYVRADGVVTTAPKAFWLFNRTKLGEKLDASK